MRYALIENGTVTNVIVLYPANAADFPGAVCCGDLPVMAGDTWDGENFLRDGKPVLSASRTLEEANGTLTSLLEEENKTLKAQIQALADRGEFIEDCIAEMAAAVYGE